MALSIRNPRVEALARDLAARRKTTMTDVIVSALENELAREREARPLRDRLADISRDLLAQAGPNGRDMTKAEIDAMWED